MIETDALVSIYDQPGIDRLRARLRIDPHEIRRLRTALFKHWQADENVYSTVPYAQALSGQVQIHALQLHDQLDSQVDGATKLLFRTKHGLLLETVLLRAGTGRTTLCVSSQVGCAAACDFCATGKMGIARDLTVAEILDQVLQAGQLAVTRRQRLRNIVFMGMGEPLHNEENLYEVLRILTHPDFFHHSPGRILVSTVGIPEAMRRCATRFPRVNQALSLHSVRQAIRQRIIPLARRYPLDVLHRSVRELNRLQAPSGADTVMLEYLMLRGVNDSADDARALIAWCHGLRVHVNLIPFNPIAEAPHLAGTNRVGCDAFAAILKQGGLKTTIRYSLGSDIAAACGQLVRKKIARQGET
jgi:23S rRNA (adenine2503-C2)-methyltransferase